MKSPFKWFEIDDPLAFSKRVELFEMRILKEEYARCQGNISHMARSLKMDRSYLFEKLKRLGIHVIRKERKLS